MGKVLVLYDSASGNTKKMAALVAEGAGKIPAVEVRLRKIDEATADDVLWCDGLALGSPTNMGLLSWKMKRFWDETMAPHWMKVDGKIGCAFSSSGGWGGGAELACQSLLTVLINFGFLVFGVSDYAGKLTTAHYGAITAREAARRRYASGLSPSRESPGRMDRRLLRRAAGGAAVNESGCLAPG
ncbi:MAG: flavodoxin domain-containing protein [Gemmataceae bacterium]